jgi:hypothetical protein
MFNELSCHNLLWLFVYKNEFPEKFNKFNIININKQQKDYNWKAESKKLWILVNGFKEIMLTINENKEKGNEKFRNKEYYESKSWYIIALDIIKNIKENDFLSIMNLNRQID